MTPDKPLSEKKGENVPLSEKEVNTFCNGQTTTKMIGNYYKEEDVKSAIRQIIDDLANWEQTSVEIPSTNLRVAITNGGYIKKFDVYEILKKRLGTQLTQDGGEDENA